MKRPAIAVVVVVLMAAVAWWVWDRHRGEPPTTIPTTTARPATVEAPTKAPVGGDEAAPAARGRAPAWSLDLDPEGPLRLEGQVVGKDGKGVGGAEVTLSSVPPRTVKSEDDGTFAFDKLVGRGYELTARTATQLGGPVPYKLTKTSDPVVIALADGAAVAVTVRDEAGKPLAGAQVVLEGHDVTATTDGAGHARLTPVAPGYVMASASAPGFSRASAIGAVGSAGATLELALTLRQGYPVSGRVVDEAGAPVARVRLAPVSTAGLFPTLASDIATSDAQGQFTFAALAPGGYTLTASDNAHAPTAVAVSVAARPVTGVVVTLKAGATVAGVVVDRDGVAVAFATVRVAGAARAMREVEGRQATADAKGRFEVRGLPRATLAIRAESDQAASKIANLDLETRGEVRDLKLVLDVSGTIAGTVVDEAGAPVPEVTVNAYPDVMGGASTEGVAFGAVASATTDGGGGFVIHGLPDGGYRLWAARGGLERSGTGPQQSTPARTGDKAVKITLAAPGLLVGKLVIAGGKTPTLATVQAGGGAPTPISGGAIQLRDLAPGSYDVTFRGAEFAELTRRDVKIEPGKTTDLGTVTVARGRRVIGRVVDGAGAPVADAKIKLGDMLISSTGDDGANLEDLMGIRGTATDASGAFVIIGVPTRATNIMADHPDRGRSIAAVVPEGTDDPPELTLTLRGYGSIVGKVTRKGEAQSGITITEATQGGGTQAAVARTGADGTFAFAKVPEGTHQLTAMQNAMMAMSTTSATVQVVAGKEAVANIDIPVGQIAVEIVVKPLPNNKVDAAQVFWFHGAVAATNAKQLTDAFLGGGGGGGGGAGGMKFWFGGDKPSPVFEEVVPGDYTACVIPITGDMSDPTFLQRMQQSVQSMKVYCKAVKVPASPVKQSATVEVPAMTPLPKPTN